MPGARSLRTHKKTVPRTLTQFVSRSVFNAGFSGIYDLSKYGHDIENWALFEPFQIAVRNPSRLLVADDGLQCALRLGKRTDARPSAGP
jgi:hypothetical protein